MAVVGTLAATAIEARILRMATKRRVFRKSGTDTAAQLIGAIADGDEICGITNGQFSLVDIIEHVLQCVGPARVAVATWTMGIYDTERAFEFVRNNLVREMRFILDPSMFSRRPEIAAILVRGFGVESFRAVNSHAKFATIRGDHLAVAVRSSMNLNPNNRIESFDISVGHEVTAFFEAVVDDIWRDVGSDNRSQSRAVFSGLLDAKEPKRHRRPNPFLGDA